MPFFPFCAELFAFASNLIFQLLLLEFYRSTLIPFLCRVDAISLKVRLEKGQLCADELLEVLDFLLRHPFRLSLFLAKLIYRVGHVLCWIQCMSTCGTLLKSENDQSPPFLKLILLLCLVFLHLITIFNILDMFDQLQFVFFNFLWFLFTNDQKGRRMFAFLKSDGITLLRSLGLGEVLKMENLRMKHKKRTQRPRGSNNFDCN